jgi:hypothetical protein
MTRPPVAVPFEVEQSGIVRLRVTAADGTAYVLRLSLAIAAVIDRQQVNADGMPVFDVQSVCAMHVIRADATAAEALQQARDIRGDAAELIAEPDSEREQTQRNLN